MEHKKLKHFYIWLNNKRSPISLNLSYNKSYNRQVKPCLLTRKLPKAELNIAAAYRENK